VTATKEHKTMHVRQSIRAAIVCASIVGVLSLAGCVRIPPGPNVMALPGSGKTFEAFQYDDAQCRRWAAYQTDPEARRAADRGLASAAVGTAIGAATGAAIGAAAGDPATGAAVGAGVGLLGGSSVGAESVERANWSLQRRYDAAYLQCMYAKGNQVPVPRGSQPAAAYAPPPPPPHPSRNIPPPPPGQPPLPPPY
jgi:hypothetical protein